MKLKAIANPSAGRGRVARALRRLQADSKRLGTPFDFVLTESQADIVAKTQQALHDGYDRILVLGGDGTLNGAANGFFKKGELINPSAALALSNEGTGSDYYRTIFKGAKSDWRETAETGDVRAVDLGEIEWMASGRRQFFLNTSTIGLGAEVVRRREAMPAALPAALAYSLPTLTTLFSYRPEQLRVTLDGKVMDERVLTIFLAKGNFAGGGMRLGAKASLDDGRLDVTVVRAMPLWRCLLSLPKLITGNFEGDPNFEKASATIIEIRSAVPVPVEADGDLLGTTDIRVTVRPKALKVCFPNR